MNVWTLYCCLVSLIFLDPTSALKVEGEIATTDDWKFMSRFCYKSRNGKLAFVIEYPKRYGTQYLLFYYDRDDIWEKIYTSTTMTCEQKKGQLNANAGQIQALDEVNSVANCRTIRQFGEDYYQCNNTQNFVSSRDMWWFLVVARCPSDANDKNLKGVNITYGFHMTNGDEGDILHREFAADEFYILPIDIAFLLAYSIMFGTSVIFGYILHKKTLFHSTYKMYIASLWVWWFHLLLYSISYGKYSADGYRNDGTNIAARVFAAISTIIFFLMLLLMANGYTIVRGRVGNITTVFISVVLTLFAIGTGVLLILEANVFDEALVLYIYEFWPGYCLIALRVVCWIIFTVLLFLTVIGHKDKARFYFPLFVWYTLWFWAGPIVILIAMFVMDKWAREKTVHGVEQFVMLCGHIFFLILTRPSAANRNFPYHVKTTQIGLLLDDDDARQQDYTVSTPEERSSETAPNFYQIFMTSTQRSVKRNDSNNSREKMVKRDNEPENDSDSSNPRYDTMDLKEKHKPPKPKSTSTLPPIGGANPPKSNSSLPPIGGAVPPANTSTLPPIRGAMPLASAPPMSHETNFSSNPSELENNSAASRDYSMFNAGYQQTE